MKKKIMISGYYGFGNIGDEAILSAIVNSIRDEEPNIEIVVLSSNNSYTENLLNVRAISRMNIPLIISELINTNLFISGGGGLMQDTTGPTSVLYYGGLLKIAQMLGVKTMIYAQGVGPLNKDHNKKLVKAIFNKATAITIRDQFAYDDLVSYGVNKNLLQVTADPVLLLKGSDKDQIKKLISDIGLDPNQKIIGISIRPWKEWYERQLKAFTSVIYQIAKKYNYQILLIPFQMSSDMWICKEAEVCFKSRPESDVNIKILEKELNPSEMMSLIGCMDVVVGMRLHSLIMASTNNIPSVGISYDPKVSYFSSLVGYPCIPSVTELQNVENTLSIIEEVIVDSEKNKLIRLEKVDKIKELSKNNVKTALKLI